MFNFMSSKAMLPGQVKILIRRDIDREMPPYDRERAIRRGGKGKTDLDDYLDIYVSDLQDILLAEANKHRTALSYERMVVRIPQLHTLLNELPLQVEEQLYDAEGNPTTTQLIDNPERIEIQLEYDTLVVGVAKIESKSDIMLIVNMRADGSN